MATNDGYSPYPLGLTAAAAAAAIKRADDLDLELSGYVKYFTGAVPPTIIEAKEGDIWHYTTNDKLYRAAIGDDGGNPVLLWFEV